jgi:outer membrane receptor protein involved in Fe transport
MEQDVVNPRCPERSSTLKTQEQHVDRPRIKAHRKDGLMKRQSFSLALLGSTALRLLRYTYPLVACSLGLLLAAGPAFAQRTTGEIVGTVTDNTGAVLPGATVELVGEHVVGIQTSTTNERGFYRFVTLHPGSYDLTFKMQGFKTLNSQGIIVPVGGTVEENVSLEIGEFSEQITVTGAAPVIDTVSNEVGMNYTEDWIRNAPIARSAFFDLINAAPGVSAASEGSSRANVLGSGTDENTYLLDGTDLTAPFTGAAWPWPNPDAIEEVEIVSLGAPAEYGNASGAVVNIVTRQGSNLWRGDIAYYSQYQSLTDRNTTDEQDGGLPYHRNKYQEFTGHIAFPIIKDKLWFMASGQYKRTSTAQPGVDPGTIPTGKSDEYMFKVNWQIKDNHRVMFSLFDDIYFDPFSQTALEAPSTVGAEHGHNPTPNLTYTGILSSETYVEARFSGFYGYDHNDPANEGFPRVAPRFYNLDTGEVTGGTYYWYDNFAYRQGLTGKVSHYAEDFAGGSHDFKFGVQYFKGGSEDGYYGANDIIYTYEAYGNTYGYGYTSSPLNYGATITGIGAFLDDTFTVNDSLTLNLGVRYDYQKASIPELTVIDPAESAAVAGGAKPTGEIVPAIDNLIDWSVFTPRIGFNLKLTEDGRTILKGHYGRYYRMMLSGEFTYSWASRSEWFAGPYDLATGEFTDLVKVYETGTNFGVNPDYSNPYTDQFIVGFERELMPKLGLGVSYTHKRGRDFPAWTDVAGVYEDTVYIDDQGAEATGQAIPVKRLVSDPDARFFEINNYPDMKTSINAFTLQLDKRMANHWKLSGSFTYLRSTGQLPSGRGGASSWQATSVIFSGFGQNPNDFVNNGGRLTGERPIAIKAQLVYEAPYGFLIGANFIHQSGRPWARRVRVPDLGLTTEINAEVRDGSRRVSAWNSLNVRVQKDLMLNDRARVSFFADALNLFNEDTNEDVLSRLGTSESFALPADFFAPRRLMIGVKFQL